MKNRGGLDLSAFSLQVLPFLILVLLAVCSFSNTLGGFFICDDLYHLPYLWRAFNGEESLLFASFFGPWLKETSFFVFYRPLTELSFALDYLIYGNHAFGYHLTSLLWHIANVFLFFILIKTVTTVPAFYIAGERQRIFLASFCAAIWCCYPTHSETISWLSARSDLIATAFYFTSLIFFAKRLTGKQTMPVALVALPVVLGLLTKELTVSLPFVLFSLYYFSCAGGQSAPWLNTVKKTFRETLPYFIILIVYLIVRTLALGDFVGGYVGSVGEGLNDSLVERWFMGPSFLKIFYPINNQIIPADSPLPVILRLVWGMCGIMTIVAARLGGAIAGKYRLMLFALAWLFFTLAPNLQIWYFSETMSGGRIAYLPTAPVVILIVFAVYPMGAWALSGKRALTLKLAAYLTLSALIVVSVVITSINNRAWLEASNVVRTVRGQLAELTDSLRPGQRLALLNLPDIVHGAFVFGTQGMVDALLKPPLASSDASASAIVLESQSCSFPYINYEDVRATASHLNNKLFQLYYFDRDQEILKKAGKDAILSPGDSKTFIPPKCHMTGHDEVKGGENYLFKIDPAINPIDFEYARLTLKRSASKATENSVEAWKQPSVVPVVQLSYFWDNCPADEDGDKESFSLRLANLPPPGQSAAYLLRLGENKRWLLSQAIGSMQIFISQLKDPGSTLQLDFVSGAELIPIFHGTVSGESAGDRLLSLKHLSGSQGQILALNFDASKVKGAKSAKIELLPPYTYFDHVTHVMAAATFVPKHLRLIDCGPALSGEILLKASDFPKPARYQLRCCALDATGKIVGDFSQVITVTVAK